MLTAVIIDDEKNAISVLSQMLTDFITIPIKILGTANNLENGIAEIQAHKPDIVFLDIDMPDRTGMEIYKYFDDPWFKVIFITAHSQYAIEAVKNSATDYLLKPIDFMELREALQKVTKEVEQEQHHRELEDRISLLTTTEMQGVNIMLEIENGFVLENTKNIEYCMADQNYSIIVTNTGRQITVAKTLKVVQDLLPTNQFYRTHKSYLVNIYYIRKFIRSSDSYVLLRSGIKVPVSVRTSHSITGDIKNILSN